MYYFDNFTEAEKLTYCEKLNDCIINFGGKNFFLQLVESIRKTTPHPLISRDCEFHFSRGTVMWNKKIFKDKLDLLMELRTNESNNIFPIGTGRVAKKTINLLRTLNPVRFDVIPQNEEDGTGFKMYPFNIIDEKNTYLNPIFDAVFFASITEVKKALNYK